MSTSTQRSDLAHKSSVPDLVSADNAQPALSVSPDQLTSPAIAKPDLDAATGHGLGTAPFTAPSAPLMGTASSVGGASAKALADTSASHEVVFVDTTLSNWQSLVKDLKPGTEVIALDPLKNGVTQMADALAGKSDIGAVHILSHGGEGYLVLGNTMLSSYNLVDYQSSLATIQKALAPGADIMLYGCDVAQGDTGAAFVNQLAKATGADVAASTNDTGAKGDWALEYHTGHVEATAIAAPQYAYDLATIKVTNLNDTGAGSLRAAVATATGNGAADTIVFDPALFASGAGTITLTTGALNVRGTGDADAFSFVGPGEGLLTISGNNASRIFVADSYVSFGNYAVNTSSLSISGMTLTNGNNSTSTRSGFGGGAIMSYGSGDLMLDHVRVTNSTSVGDGGGVLFYDATSNFTLSNSTLSGNTQTGASAYGGGLSATGTGASVTVSIISSTLSGNSSYRGGGGARLAANTGNVSVVNTTIANNNSNVSGSNTLAGGGLLIQGGTTSIVNSTITGNIAHSSTIGQAVDGGGVAMTSGAVVSFKNTLIAGNTSASSGTAFDDLGVGQNATASGSNNLIVATVGVYSPGGGGANGTNSLTGTITSLGSALGTLAYNGGAVKTIAIATGSNAISAGTGTGAPTIDARGFGRGGTTDIGAYEFSDNNTFSFSGVVSPANGLIDVPIGYDLVIDFGFAVSAVAAKNIVIYNQSNAVLETIAANDTGKVTFSTGTGGANSKVTINPTANLVSGTAYYVLIDSGAFQDGSSNTFNGISSTSAWTFTTAASLAAITSATYNASAGTLVVTGTGMTTSDAIDATKLTVTGESGGTYTLSAGSSTTASSATSFTITLTAADKIAINGLLNKNASTTAVSGTTFNLAGAAGWDSTAGAAADLTGNGITTSNVSAPTITSATYNESTHVFTVTGTGLVGVSGATNDITVSKLTITGQGGTHTFSTTGNVEVTSATSFSFTVAGTDVAAVDGLLNINGSVSSGGTTYNLSAADDWNSVITGGDISDATNAITVSNAPASITDASYNAATGVLTVTGLNITNGGTIDVSKLALTGQGGSYSLTTGNVTASSTTAFSVTLNAADKIAVNGILNQNGTVSATGAVTFNLAASANWDVTASAGADLTGNLVTVSSVAQPTITSATYDGTTHVFTVTGTNLVKTVGATNDITISALTITGEGGATRTLNTTSNVEITSDTSFSFTLAGADIAAVDNLLNKNGTASATSSTTYNIAAADDWDSVITGGNIADLTSNGITVSNAAPSILSASYDAATGILSVSAVNIVGGDTIDVSKLSLTGQAGSYTLTTANVTASSSTAFSVTLNAADKIAINGILNNNGSTAVDTTTFNLAAAASWDATTTSSADLTGNGVTVSNVTAPTITSATYDGTTHVFTVTGTGLVKTIGATNDITISKLTITGEGGVTRTLSTTGNVEITSDTSFSFTVAGADIAAVDGLLNKNGTASATSTTTYNIAAADDWDSVITGGNISDATSNGITVSNAAPSILSASYDAATGILSVSAVNIVGGDTIDVSKLSLTGQGGSYTLTTANVTAASSTAFAVTLNAAEKIAINGILNNNGSTAVDTTTFNLAAAASWDATTTSSADLTGNGVTVSNVTAPTITSATYDQATGVLVVTGTDLVKTIGATNDITVTKLTITGEGGATYTLSTSSNVEITSATSFSLTLTGADIAGVDNLLNKNGTASATSTTTYNIAAADDWDSVITGGNIADLTGNGITVSNAAPVVVSATYDAATGSLVVSGANMVTGDTIDVSKLSLTGQAGSYTLTSANVTAASATSFTVALNAADLLNINGILNKNGTAAVDTTTFNLAAAASWDTSRTTAADLTGNGVTATNVTAPTITSATYDGTTHVFTVTGTGLVKTIGATNDITLSKLTITGEGGVTRTLSTTSNVEITSGTSFSFTLAGADIAAVDNLLNKNGTASATSTTTYNIAAADDWDSVITGGNIADLTSNGITVSNAAPVVVSATYDASTGSLSVAALNIVGGDTIDVSKLSLTGQGGSYTLTSANVTAASSTAFSVTLNAADKIAINGILNNNGTAAVDTTTFNLAAAASWDATTTSSADLTGNGVTVSNVTAPTITSATYDQATGVLVVTGTNLVKTIGATNDITVTKLTITGEGGATYTLATSSDVEITSATSFSLTLTGADIAGVKALLNKDGTASAASTTTYNIAAADDWDSVITPTTGSNIADLTGNGITVSNAAPVVVSATYDAATGSLVVTGANMVTGDTIDVSKLSLTGQAGSYTLTTANVTAASATSFTVALNAADLLNINGILNKDGTVAVDTTTFNLAAAASWDTSRTTAADLTGNGVTASNVTAPTITSATYNGSTNTLVVTGTGLVKTVGATNDITVNKLTITGEGGATYTLSTTSNVEATSATSFSVTLSGADIAGVAALLNKNGTSAVSTTTYNIAAADDWDSVITGGNISDATSNGITVSNAAPSILSSTYDASTGILSVSAVNIVGGDTIDVSKLSLTGQGGSYTLTTANVTASSGTAFSVTLNAADKIAINGILNNNGTTAVDTSTFNLAAAASWDQTTTSGADLTGNGVTASNVTAPTITSATYDGTTHVFTVTGTGLVKTIGATNDITVTKLTILGEGGVTRTLSTTSNVEITSDTSFSFTLAGADIAAVDALLNKSGTTSVGSTTYNIAAADDWDSVITGGNIADATGNGITVSNAVPPAPSAPDLTAGTDSGTSSTDDLTKITTPTFTGTSVAGATVTLYDTDGTTVRGSTTADGSGNWSITSTTLAEGAHTLTTKATVGAGVSVASTSLAVTIDTTAPTATIATSAFSADTGTSSTDFITKTAAQTLSGTVSANMVAGEFVEVSLNNGGTWTTATTTVGLNTWSLAGQTLTASDTLKVRVTDTAGNTGTVASQVYVLDTTAPTATILTSAFSADTGVSNTDFITGSTAQTVSGTVSANMVAGELVEVSLNNGTTWTTAATTVGLNTWSLAGQTLTASDTLKVRVADLAGNTGTIASQAYVLDTTAPVFASGTVNGNTLVLTYTDAALLDPTNVAPNGAFSVLAAGTPNAVTAVAVNAASKTVTLTLTSAVNNGQVVTVAYTDPTGGNDANATQDAAGNDAATLAATAVVNNTAPPVGNTSPVINTATYDAATGTLVVNGARFVALGGAANDIDVSKLAILGEGGVSRSLTSASVDITDSTSFTVNLNSADKALIDQIVNQSGVISTGGTFYNLAAAEQWAAGAASNLLVADLTGNSITASNVATPAITSATYDATTGVLTVTGTGFSQLAGAANDIDVSKLSIQGDATPYTLTSASVDISSGTRFSITLNAADQAALTSRINVSGLVSQGGVTYNLAAAEDWAKGAATAIVVADLSGNGITATLTCPYDPFRIDADKDGVPDAVELASGTNPAVKDNNVFANTSLFVNQLYRDLFGREGAGDAGAQYWTGLLNNGSQTKTQLLQTFLDSPEFNTHAGAVMELYHAAFNRNPELCGYNYWLGQVNAGTSLTEVARNFVASAEFQTNTASLSNAAYIDLLYQNALHRTADAGGKAYWVGVLGSGTADRTTVFVNIALSTEAQSAQKANVAVDTLYLGLLDRGVTAVDSAYWAGQYANYSSTAQFLQAATASTAEYHDRVLPATTPVTVVGVLQDMALGS